MHISDNNTLDSNPCSARVSGEVLYYPFGILMPGRQFLATSTAGYRFGFNGQEKVNEVKGTGNFYDFGRRPYDSRISRLISVDPLSEDYPWYTPYQFAGNSPIAYIDWLGLQPVKVITQCFAPYDEFGCTQGGCYSGDGNNRKFADGGSYRISGAVDFDLTTFEKKGEQAGTTTSRFHQNGAPSDLDIVRTSPSHIKTVLCNQDKLGKQIGAIFKVWGSNQAAAVSADIDNKVFVFFSQVGKNKFSVQGNVVGDRFPSSETYMQDKFGNKLILGVSGPEGPDKDTGPYVNLPGENSRKMCSFKFTV